MNLSRREKTEITQHIMQTLVVTSDTRIEELITNALSRLDNLDFQSVLKNKFRFEIHTSFKEIFEFNKESIVSFFTQYDYEKDFGAVTVQYLTPSIFYGDVSLRSSDFLNIVNKIIDSSLKFGYVLFEEIKSYVVDEFLGSANESMRLHLDILLDLLLIEVLFKNVKGGSDRMEVENLLNIASRTKLGRWV